MFSLIITIIAIALVAALALASIYYGGSAFNKGSEKAQASTLINNAMQVAAAMTLADTDGYTYTGGIDHATDPDLVGGGYLASAPADLSIDANGDVAAAVSNQAVCDVINGQSGNTVVTFDSATQTVGEVIDAQFGCANDTNATPTGLHFAFKH